MDSDVRGRRSRPRPPSAAFPGGWYRNQFWFRPGAYGDVLLCLGIHGQMLHVSRRTNTVCVKFSSWPQAQNPAYLEDTLRAFDAVGGVLAGRDPDPGAAPPGRCGLRAEPPRRYRPADPADPALPADRDLSLDGGAGGA